VKNNMDDVATSRSSNSSHITALIVAAIAAFVVFLDTTIVNLALPTLSREFNADRSSIEWILNAYTLAFAAIMLSAGVMSDRFGAKRIFIPGVLVFMIASIGCAEAQNITMLNLFRLVQGAGAALLLPSSLSLAIHNVDEVQLRRVAISLWSAAGGVGMAAGPLVGGLVVNSLGWRWMFWMNVLVGLVAVALTFQLGPSLPRAKLRLDIFGQITATIAIGCLVFIFIEGPHLGWNALPLLLSATLGIAAIVSFVMGERKTPHPLIPPRLAARAEFIGSAILGALFNLSFYGVLFALSLLLQDVKGESALRAGLSFLPLTGLIFVGSLIAPRISLRTSTNSVLYLGQTLLAGGLLLTIFTAPLAQAWPLAISLLPMGFGSGLLVPTMTARMLESLPQDLTGAASGSFNTSRQLGGAIGVALFGTLLGSSSHINTGFTTCLTVSLVCIAVSAALTLTLLRGTKRRAKQATQHFKL
jgi:DHA2 family methylenomycin A resistance protein-like MFS transporter